MRRPLLRWTLPAAALLLAACTESSTAPAAEDAAYTDDLARIAAEAALTDLDLLAGVIPSAGAGLAVDADRTVERNRSVTWYDADGSEMGAYDSLLTASVRRTSSVTVAGSRGAWSSSRESTREDVITGLLGSETERTHDGSGTTSRSRTVISDETGSRAYEASGSAEIRSVVRAVDRVANPWPLSGAIAREYTVTRTGTDADGTTSTSTLLTFDGTRFATLEVNGEVYEVDLGTRDPDRGVRRRGNRGGS